MQNISDERIEALVAELHRLRAMEEIRARIYSCARALDRLDRGLLQQQFWQDADVDYGSIYQGGVAGFIDVAMQFQGGMRDTQHLVGNVLPTISGNHATSESYVQAQHVMQDGSAFKQLIVGGRYLDRFECRGGEWRIIYRTEVIDWGRLLPIPENWFDQSTELPKGMRTPQDLSYRFVI